VNILAYVLAEVKSWRFFLLRNKFYVLIAMITHCFKVWAGFYYIKFIGSITALADYFSHKSDNVVPVPAVAFAKTSYNAEAKVKVHHRNKL
jgi:hypothetical protein